MPVLQFKGKSAVETHHWTLPHHVLELDHALSVLPKKGPPSLDGNLFIEGGVAVLEELLEPGVELIGVEAKLIAKV